jgi:hypothetical protein
LTQLSLSAALLNPAGLVHRGVHVGVFVFNGLAQLAQVLASVVHVAHFTLHSVQTGSPLVAVFTHPAAQAVHTVALVHPLHFTSQSEH